MNDLLATYKNIADQRLGDIIELADNPYTINLTAEYWPFDLCSDTGYTPKTAAQFKQIADISKDNLLVDVADATGQAIIQWKITSNESFWLECVRRKNYWSVIEIKHAFIFENLTAIAQLRDNFLLVVKEAAERLIIAKELFL